MVLDGEVEIVVGRERVRAARGTLEVVPSMAPHSVYSVGSGPARMVGFFPSPGVERLNRLQFVEIGKVFPTGEKARCDVYAVSCAFALGTAEKPNAVAQFGGSSTASGDS